MFIDGNAVFEERDVFVGFEDFDFREEIAERPWMGSQRTKNQ